jgi:hypothetical protein
MIGSSHDRSTVVPYAGKIPPLHQCQVFSLLTRRGDRRRVTAWVDPTELDPKSGLQLQYQGFDTAEVPWLRRGLQGVPRGESSGLLIGPYSWHRIMIATPDWEQHKELLEILLRVDSRIGETMEPGECRFGYSRVDYLGHEISAEGIRPRKETLEGLEESRCPNTASGLRRFMGSAYHLRAYLPLFNVLTSQLYGPGAEKRSPEERNIDFDNSRQAMLHPEPLGIPDYQSDSLFEIYATIHTSPVWTFVVQLAQQQGSRYRILHNDSNNRNLWENGRPLYVSEIKALQAGLEKWADYYQGHPVVAWVAESPTGDGRLRLDPGQRMGGNPINEGSTTVWWQARGDSKPRPTVMEIYRSRGMERPARRHPQATIEAICRALTRPEWRRASINQWDHYQEEIGGGEEPLPTKETPPRQKGAARPSTARGTPQDQKEGSPSDLRPNTGTRDRSRIIPALQTVLVQRIFQQQWQVPSRDNLEFFPSTTEPVGMMGSLPEGAETQRLRVWIPRGHRPTRTELAMAPGQLRSDMEWWEQLKVASPQGPIIRAASQWERCQGNRIGVALERQTTILAHCHQGPGGGHLNTRATLAVLGAATYFPGMVRRVEGFVEHCLTCNPRSGPPAPELTPNQHCLRGVCGPYPLYRTTGTVELQPWAQVYVGILTDLTTRTVHLDLLTVHQPLIGHGHGIITSFVKMLDQLRIRETLRSLRGGPGTHPMTHDLIQGMKSELGRRQGPQTQPQGTWKIWDPLPGAHRVMVQHSPYMPLKQRGREVLVPLARLLNTVRSPGKLLTPQEQRAGGIWADNSGALTVADLLPPPGTVVAPGPILDSVYRAMSRTARGAVRLAPNHNSVATIQPGDLVYLLTPQLGRDETETREEIRTQSWTGPWKVKDRVTNLLWNPEVHGDWNPPINLAATTPRMAPWLGGIPPYPSTSQPPIAWKDVAMSDEMLEGALELNPRGVPGGGKSTNPLPALQQNEQFDQLLDSVTPVKPVAPAKKDLRTEKEERPHPTRRTNSVGKSETAAEGLLWRTPGGLGHSAKKGDKDQGAISQPGPCRYNPETRSPPGQERNWAFHRETVAIELTEFPVKEGPGIPSKAHPGADRDYPKKKFPKKQDPMAEPIIIQIRRRSPEPRTRESRGPGDFKLGRQY